MASDSATVRFVRDDAPFRKGDVKACTQAEARKLIGQGVAVAASTAQVSPAPPAAALIEDPAGPGPRPWHSARGHVYHVHAACDVGNNIEGANRRDGTGDLTLCEKCRRLIEDAEA